jgi:putative ATP-dependent endonuclease of the OLD family
MHRASFSWLLSCGREDMFISELSVENFRIFGEGTHALILPLTPGLTALVGENDAGKTAVIDALRFALGTRDQEYLRIVESDFHHPLDSEKPRKTISIRCKFDGLSLSDRAAFAEYLTFEARDGARVPVLYVNWKADEVEKIPRRRRLVAVEVTSGLLGDGPQFDVEAREHLCATYLRPLRDAERSMSAGRGSRLSEILENTPGIDCGSEYDKNGGTPQDHTALSIVGIGDLADDLLNRHVGVKAANDRLNTQYLKRLSFSGSQLQGSIAVGGAERHKNIRLRQLLEKLDLELHDDSAPSTPSRRGLGSNNLLFMACELLLLGDDEEHFPILLIEEPEAHLHPQRQLLLMEFLQQRADDARNNKPQIQIIVTTHSPNLASAINLENLVLLHGGKAFSLAPAYTKLQKSDYKFLQRFLDVTKANMFFSRGLLIVEGDAENILLPTIAHLINRDFAENGVSIVNVGGTGLGRFARIYQRKASDETIDIPVACITDFDVMPDCAPEILGKVNSGETWPEVSKRNWRAKKDFSAKGLSSRRDRIRGKASGQNVETFIADEWTLEYDLAFSGLAEYVWIAAQLAKCDDQISAKTKTVYSVARKAARTYRELRQRLPGKEELASHIYKLFASDSNVSKATAAQYLANVLTAKCKHKKLSAGDLLENLPPYILKAIKYVTAKNAPDSQKNGEASPNA